MELNKKINVRISEDQLKILMSAVIDEKTTLSNLLRHIINGYNKEISKSKDKWSVRKVFLKGKSNIQ